MQSQQFALVDRDASVPAERLRQLYDGRASVYGELWSPVLEPAGLHLIESLRAKRRRAVASVLDMGTGVGALLPHLATRFPGAELTGIDTSPGMLALAPPAHARRIMDAQRLDFPSASVDLIVAAFMLFYLTSPLDGLREARRVLRNGGLFGSATWASVPECAADRIWRKCLDRYGAATPPAVVPSSGVDLDTPEELETLLRVAGFDDVECWVGPLQSPLDRDRLLVLRQHMGPDVGRFRSLDPRRRSACVEDARRSMAGLPIEDFSLSARVVYAMGVAG